MTSCSTIWQRCIVFVSSVFLILVTSIYDVNAQSNSESNPTENRNFLYIDLGSEYDQQVNDLDIRSVLRKVDYAVTTDKIKSVWLMQLNSNKPTDIEHARIDAQKLFPNAVVKVLDEKGYIAVVKSLQQN